MANWLWGFLRQQIRGGAGDGLHPQSGRAPSPMEIHRRIRGPAGEARHSLRRTLPMGLTRLGLTHLGMFRSFGPLNPFGATVNPDLTIGATSCRPSGPKASPVAAWRRRFSG